MLVLAAGVSSVASVAASLGVRDRFRVACGTPRVCVSPCRGKFVTDASVCVGLDRARPPSKHQEEVRVSERRVARGCAHVRDSYKYGVGHVYMLNDWFSSVAMSCPG